MPVRHAEYSSSTRIPQTLISQFKFSKQPRVSSFLLIVADPERHVATHHSTALSPWAIEGVPSPDLVPSSSNMDFLGVLLYVYERLSARAVPGHQALRRQEAKYTAMDDERRSHAARQDTAWVKRADATAARMRRESQTSSRSRHEWMAA